MTTSIDGRDRQLRPIPVCLAHAAEPLLGAPFLKAQEAQDPGLSRTSIHAAITLAPPPGGRGMVSLTKPAATALSCVLRYPYRACSTKPILPLAAIIITDRCVALVASQPQRGSPCMAAPPTQ